MGNKSNIRDILPAAERCVLGETGKGGVTAGRQVSMHNEHYQHIMQASTIKGNKFLKKIYDQHLASHSRSQQF